MSAEAHDLIVEMFRQFKACCVDGVLAGRDTANEGAIDAVLRLRIHLEAASVESVRSLHPSFLCRNSYKEDHVLVRHSCNNCLKT